MLFSRRLLQLIHDKENDEARLLLTDMHPVKSLADSTGNTLLHYAASYGNEFVTQYLVKVGCNVDAQNQDLKTPIVLAVEAQHKSTVQILLGANADINIPDGRGKSVLHVIADLTESTPLSIVRMFLARVKREACCSEAIARRLFAADWPLFYAVTLRDTEVTRIMLKLGSPINAVGTPYKLTALHGAVLLVDPGNVKLLVDHGADVNVKCVDGSAPLGCLHNFDDPASVREIIKILLERNTRWTDCESSVPMQIYDVCVSGSSEIVRSLMEHDVDLFAKDSNGETPLHYLTENKNPGVFEELRGRAFEVDATDDFGLTPLHKAVWCGNVEAMQFLLEFGADVKAASDTGFTPMFYAMMDSHRSLYEPDDEDDEVEGNNVARKKDKRVVEILLEHGAEIEVADGDDGTMSVFELTQFKTSPLSKLVIAHVAMLHVLGRPISENIRRSLESDRSTKRHFDLCERRYEHMKVTRVYESVTLLDLLTASDEQIAHYARNRQLVLNLALMIDEGAPDSYHYGKMQRRLADAVARLDRKKLAVVVLDSMMRHTCSNSGLAANLVIDYLEEDDWLTLKTLS